MNDAGRTRKARRWSVWKGPLPLVRQVAVAVGLSLGVTGFTMFGLSFTDASSSDIVLAGAGVLTGFATLSGSYFAARAAVEASQAAQISNALTARAAEEASQAARISNALAFAQTIVEFTGQVHWTPETASYYLALQCQGANIELVKVEVLLVSRQPPAMESFQVRMPGDRMLPHGVTNRGYDLEPPPSRLLPMFFPGLNANVTVTYTVGGGLDERVATFGAPVT